MGSWKHTVNRIPFWAFLLALTAIIVNSLYLHYKSQVPVDGLLVRFENDHGLLH
jgi:hypothetical protein